MSTYRAFVRFLKTNLPPSMSFANQSFQIDFDLTEDDILYTNRPTIDTANQGLLFIQASSHQIRDYSDLSSHYSSAFQTVLKVPSFDASLLELYQTMGGKLAMALNQQHDAVIISSSLKATHPHIYPSNSTLKHLLIQLNTIVCTHSEFFIILLSQTNTYLQSRSFKDLFEASPPPFILSPKSTQKATTNVVPQDIPVATLQTIFTLFIAFISFVQHIYINQSQFLAKLYKYGHIDTLITFTPHLQPSTQFNTLLTFALILIPTSHIPEQFFEPDVVIETSTEFVNTTNTIDKKDKKDKKEILGRTRGESKTMNNINMNDTDITDQIDNKNDNDLIIPSQTTNSAEISHKNDLQISRHVRYQNKSPYYYLSLLSSTMYCPLQVSSSVLAPTLGSQHHNEVNDNFKPFTFQTNVIDNHFLFLSSFTSFSLIYSLATTHNERTNAFVKTPPASTSGQQTNTQQEPNDGTPQQPLDSAMASSSMIQTAPKSIHAQRGGGIRDSDANKNSFFFSSSNGLRHGVGLGSEFTSKVQSSTLDDKHELSTLLSRNHPISMSEYDQSRLVFASLVNLPVILLNQLYHASLLFGQYNLSFLSGTIISQLVSLPKNLEQSQVYQVNLHRLQSQLWFLGILTGLCNISSLRFADLITTNSFLPAPHFKNPNPKMEYRQSNPIRPPPQTPQSGPNPWSEDIYMLFSHFLTLPNDFITIPILTQQVYMNEHGTLTTKPNNTHLSIIESRNDKDNDNNNNNAQIHPSQDQAIISSLPVFGVQMYPKKLKALNYSLSDQYFPFITHRNETYSLPPLPNSFSLIQQFISLFYITSTQSSIYSNINFIFPAQLTPFSLFFAGTHNNSIQSQPLPCSQQLTSPFSMLYHQPHMFYIFNLIMHQVYNQCNSIYFHDFYSIFFESIMPLPMQPALRTDTYRLVEEFCAVYIKWAQNNASYPIIESINILPPFSPSNSGKSSSELALSCPNYQLSQRIVNITGPLAIFTHNPIYIQPRFKQPVTASQSTQTSSSLVFTEPFIELHLTTLSSLPYTHTSSNIHYPVPTSNLSTLTKTLAISNVIHQDHVKLQQTVHHIQLTAQLVAQNSYNRYLQLIQKSESKQQQQQQQNISQSQGFAAKTHQLFDGQNFQ